jgi:hypothetical protein
MIAWEGDSLLNGEPIALILTQGSKNKKTGDMLQSWIIPQKGNLLHKDVDISVCGNCPLREGACYVTKFQAPRNVQKTYQRGGYELIKPNNIRNEILRVGSWGDPAALPAIIWQRLLRRTTLSGKHTGYTHQWRTCDPVFATFCMASVENEADMNLAHSMGYRTFRVKNFEEPALPNEVMCLNTKIGVTCKQCTMCNASSGDIVINVHGTPRSINKYEIIRTQFIASENEPDQL